MELAHGAWLPSLRQPEPGRTSRRERAGSPGAHRSQGRADTGVAGVRSEVTPWGFGKWGQPMRGGGAGLIGRRLPLSRPCCFPQWGDVALQAPEGLPSVLPRRAGRHRSRGGPSRLVSGRSHPGEARASGGSVLEEALAGLRHTDRPCRRSRHPCSLGAASWEQPLGAGRRAACTSQGRGAGEAPHRARGQLFSMTAPSSAWDTGLLVSGEGQGAPFTPEVERCPGAGTLALSSTVSGPAVSCPSSSLAAALCHCPGPHPSPEGLVCSGRRAQHTLWHTPEVGLWASPADGPLKVLPPSPPPSSPEALPPSPPALPESSRSSPAQVAL